MKQKLTCVATSVIVSMMACHVMAAKEVFYDDIWTYTVSYGEASLGSGSRTGVGALNSVNAVGEITIPSTLGEYPVKRIGICAFGNGKYPKITRVIIPDGVTSIGEAAFSSCTGLTDVTIPEGVTNIDTSAFSSCSALTGITLPQSLMTIGAGAFQSCKELSSMTIPDGVSSMGDYVFSSCSKLTTVTLPSGIKEIGWAFFSGCSSLTNVNIPSGVTTIEKDAFKDCSTLPKLTIPNSVTSIGADAFNGCSSLSIDFEGAPPTLYDARINTSTPIRYNAVYASEWRSTIKQYGFTNTEEYWLPLDDGGPYSEEVDGVIWSYCMVNRAAVLGHKGIRAISQETVGKVNLPESLGHADVATIEGSAFQGCAEITDLTIPSTVTNINDGAFGGCSKLVAFDVDESNPIYASVGGLLYDKSKSVLLCVPRGLTEVTIPANTLSIADGAFGSCGKLASVTFLGRPPSKTYYVFDGTPDGLVIHADATQAGWITWGGKPIAFDVGTGGASSIGINLTVTNVVVHYIQTSELSPMSAPISKDVGIVNVMTEIKGGNISIPDSWVTNYPSFKSTFGSDFSNALICETGKFDAGGKPMYVWQDYIAGTDPTKKDSVFRASVTMVEGKPVVSYTPELSAEEKAKRKYTTWGKVKLQDADWSVVPSGSEPDYNFFKVSVEMRSESK